MNLLDEVLVEHIFSGGSEIISASILLFKKVRKKSVVIRSEEAVRTVCGVLYGKRCLL
jgi:hypothetical protein